MTIYIDTFTSCHIQSKHEKCYKLHAISSLSIENELQLFLHLQVFYTTAILRSEILFSKKVHPAHELCLNTF